MRIEEVAKGRAHWNVYGSVDGKEHHIAKIEYGGDYKFWSRTVKGDIVKHESQLAATLSVIEAIEATKAYFAFFYPEFGQVEGTSC